MNTYLLKWTREKSEWASFERDCEQFAQQGFLESERRCMSNRPIVGDRVFLLKQGKSPKGIIGSGIINSPPALRPHHSGGGKTTLKVCVVWDTIINPDKAPILARESLDSIEGTAWDTPASGIEIPSDAASALELLWSTFLIQSGYSPVSFAEEVSASERFWEGALRRITVNAYERDSKARQACIAYFGAACRACGFDFGSVYGELGCGYIHVHHTRPLSEIGEGYAVDPLKDLIPVCPNCHAMLHQQTPPLTVEELRVLMSRGTVAV